MATYEHGGILFFVLRYFLNSSSVWAEINLGAIAHNVREIRRFIKPDVCLMAVVKSNAYGHGIIETAQCVLANGAGALGVGRISEGICLRASGIDVPILIFGFTPPQLVGKLLEYDLTQTVYSLETAREFSDAALASGGNVKIHLKIDTGMGRLGVMPDSINECILIAQLPGLYMEGIYTHFATADSKNRSYANKQFNIFKELLDKLHKKGLHVPLRHAANSAATINMPEAHFDMVRCGILLYGLYPSADIKKDAVCVRPAMALKSRIIHLKKVPSGARISYGAFYETKKPAIIATVSAGYGDGVNRLLSSSGSMLVRGRRVRITGRICMDMTMLDVGQLDVSRGDEVVIFGNQGDEFLGADEIAAAVNTIGYEILTSIPSNLHRVYRFHDN